MESINSGTSIHLYGDSAVNYSESINLEASYTLEIKDKVKVTLSYLEAKALYDKLNSYFGCQITTYPPNIYPYYGTQIAINNTENIPDNLKVYCSTDTERTEK